MIEATRAAIERATAPLLDTQRELLARIDQQAQAIESLERRASRHVEHLHALDSKVKALQNSK